MKQRTPFILILALIVTGISCGGGGDSKGLGSATTITGTVVSANGIDPISGAVVYIPGASTSLKSDIVAPSKKLSVDCGTKGGTISCTAATETACASTCSCSDGSYSLTTTGCSSDSTTVNFCKGSFCGKTTLECKDEACTANITGAKTTDSIPAMAVVTGRFDEIENVLAKLGLGEVQSTGLLKIGTESFTIYLGGGARDSEYTDTAKYKSTSVLFGSLTEMQKYSIIFINCGSNQDPTSGALVAALTAGSDLQASHTAYHNLLMTTKTKGLSSGVVSNIQNFVAGGGKLYVTDLAYDFIEQSHPSFMDFQGDGTSATSAETVGAADLGTSGITSDATIKNDALKSWMQGSALTTNTIGANTPGTSCTTTAGGNSGSKNLNSDGTIRIGDFLSGWAVMNSAYSGVSPAPYTWIEGPVTFSGQTTAVTRPLTVSQKVGSKGGCLLYSSYHTSESCPTTGFWPQERFLQYVVFEVGDTCTP